MFMKKDILKILMDKRRNNTADLIFILREQSGDTVGEVLVRENVIAKLTKFAKVHNITPEFFNDLPHRKQHQKLTHASRIEATVRASEKDLALCYLDGEKLTYDHEAVINFGVGVDNYHGRCENRIYIRLTITAWQNGYRVYTGVQGISSDIIEYHKESRRLYKLLTQPL
jgi:hypothetical protein